MSTAKTVAGITAATGATTAVSYVITDSVSNKQEPTPARQVADTDVAPQPKKMGQILEEAKFTKLTFYTKYSEMEEIQKILKKFPHATITGQANQREALKKECQGKINEKYNETDYKLLVQKCVKLDTFKQRATKLELSPKDTEATDNTWASPAASNFQTKISKSKFSGIFTTQTSDKEKNYCKKVEGLTVNDFASSEEITKEWGVYGNICLPENKTSKDFWLGDSSI